MAHSAPTDNAAFLALLDTLTDAFWIKPEGGAMLCSKALTAIYGCSEDDLRRDPKAWLQAVHPDDREQARLSSAELARTGTARATYRIVRPDGDVRWIDDQKSWLKTPTGNLKGGICRDITARKTAEQLADLQRAVLGAVATDADCRTSLDLLCRRIESLVPQSVVTVLVLDEEQRLRVAAAPGCPPELTAAIDGLVPGNDVGSCGTAAFTGVPCIVEDTMTDPRWDSLREAARHFGIRSCWSIPILSHKDSVRGTIAISSFVQRKPNEFHQQLLETGTQLARIALQHDSYLRELVDAKKLAEAGAKAKSEILANVSHELRTPLTAILGFTELVLDGPPPAELVDPMTSIRDSGQHLLTVINDLLDVSKIEAGRIVLVHEPCSLRQVLRDALVPIEDGVRQRGLALTVAGMDELPDRVTTDPTRLRQIMLNLLSNAVKFTEQGGIEIRCHAEPLDSGTVRIAIHVTDSGVGIAPELCAKVFDPFVQADASTSRRFGGTGLGLTLSRRLARLLGGDLTVESVPGHGTTFTFAAAMPIAAAPGPDAATVDPLTAAPTPPTRLACRVLVVEDTPMLRKYVATTLRRAGAHVELAENGEQGLQAALAAQDAAPFDVVVMDMQMPVMTGYDAVRTLRANGYAQPILALTARAQAGDEDECLQAGCDRYLAKPAMPRELIAAVSELVDDAAGRRPSE